MERIYKSLIELIGNTPLLELSNIEREEALKARLFVKVESFNPGGSVKDRAAYYMIEDAEKRGVLTPGALIIEPTSGNTGIGLALGRFAEGVQTGADDARHDERRATQSAQGIGRVHRVDSRSRGHVGRNTQGYGAEG